MVCFVDRVLDDAAAVRDRHRAPGLALLSHAAVGQPRVLGDGVHQGDDLDELIDRKPRIRQGISHSLGGFNRPEVFVVTTGHRAAAGAAPPQDLSARLGLRGVRMSGLRGHYCLRSVADDGQSSPSAASR